MSLDVNLYSYLSQNHEKILYSVYILTFMIIPSTFDQGQDHAARQSETKPLIMLQRPMERYGLADHR